MEKIEPGKYVEMVYNLYELNAADEEKLVHEVDEDDPEKIVFGVTRGVIVPFEKAIEGKSAGDTFEVDVKAAEAFGPHDPEQVAELERDIFMIDGKFDAEHIKKGSLVPMMTADGYRINGLVVKVTDSHVTMDFNHPLAGKDVRFKGKILNVREATPDELKPAQGCCGCQGGECGDGGCGSQGGCGCDNCGE